MLKLREIMTRDVLTVSPDLSIRGAMEYFTTRHVSAMPVVAAGAVIGILSATDLITFAASLPGVPTERSDSLEWGEWESSPSGQPEENDPTAAYFTQMWDDAGATSTERWAEVTGPEWNVLEEHTVIEAMTPAPVLSMRPDALVTAAADAMRRDGMHHVLVTEGEALLGIVSTMDIAKAVADHQLATQTFRFGGGRHFNGGAGSQRSMRGRRA